MRPTEAALHRATMTISCRDAESIPKVAAAGTVEVVDGTSVQIMHNGLRVLYGGYHGDWMANIIHGLRGHHEPQEEKAFFEVLRYCRPKTCILEVGAFWAYYSMWYLRSIPFSAACCIEPDGEHMAVGQENMRLNRLHASFLQACVGNQFLAEKTFRTESDASIVLPQHTVQSAMEHFGWKDIEVLHADVQGVELELLFSCESLFAAGNIRFLIISTHHSSISGSTSTHRDCVDYLTAQGARIVCEHDVDESFSGDGLIVAAMRQEDKRIPDILVSRCRRSESLFLSGY